MRRAKLTKKVKKYTEKFVSESRPNHDISLDKLESGKEYAFVYIEMY